MDGLNQETYQIFKYGAIRKQTTGNYADCPSFVVTN
ncbi:hypothetical protein SAMN05421820_101767 [Pedobacter steynii]|uniref:Uncharacterized protein n=1 Tax=Pedobacter steynii TaxID=430522 RepID=A0A1G9L556_9SPHI|nr:hypothetical protein SAMN05421820_101767 [Pedobacter steynii]